MVRPIIDAVKARIRENRPIAAAVVDGLTNAVRDQNSSVETVDDATVASVTAAVAPIVANARNEEPWWQSRIKIGTLVIAVTMVARWFGVEIPAVPDADMDIIYNVLTTFGGGVVGLGRWLKNRPPISWRRPWTLFGIGR